MATFKEHCTDTQRLLGDPCKEVHKWLDDYAPVLKGAHRKIRHHRIGVMKATQLFGEIGEKAAVIHILKDCGHVPHVFEYNSGRVDVFGCALPNTIDEKGRFIGFLVTNSDVLVPDNDYFDQIAKSYYRKIWGKEL